MSRKNFIVCLLALAGSVSIYAASVERGRTGPLHSAVNHQPRRSARSSARGVPKGTSIDAASHALKARATWFANHIEFEPNVGQADARAQFVGRGKGMTVLLMRDGFTLVVPRRAQEKASGPGGNGAKFRDDMMNIRLVQDASLSWIGEEKLRGETNYFVGKDSRKWRTRVPHYARAKTASRSDGASLAFYGNNEGVEYDLRIPPEMDVTKLRLALSGTQGVRLDQNGDLLMNVAGTEFRMRKPAIYEEGANSVQVSQPANLSPIRPQEAAKRPSAPHGKTVGAGGPKKKTRRTTPKSVEKAQRHRARKKIRGTNARPPAMRRPRANPPQKKKRPPKVDKRRGASVWRPKRP